MRKHEGKMPEFNNNGKYFKSLDKDFIERRMKESYFRCLSPTTNEPFGPGFWIVSDASDYVKNTWGSAFEAPPGKLIPIIEEFSLTS